MTIGTFRLFCGVVGAVSGAIGAVVGMAIIDKIVESRKPRLTFASQLKLEKQCRDYYAEHIKDDPFGVNFVPKGMFEVYNG